MLLPQITPPPLLPRQDLLGEASAILSLYFGSSSAASILSAYSNDVNRITSLLASLTSLQRTTSTPLPTTPTAIGPVTTPTSVSTIVSSSRTRLVSAVSSLISQVSASSSSVSVSSASVLQSSASVKPVIASQNNASHSLSTGAKVGIIVGECFTSLDGNPSHSKLSKDQSSEVYFYSPSSSSSVSVYVDVDVSKHIKEIL